MCVYMYVIIQRLEFHFENDLTTPHDNITVDDVKSTTISASMPDGVNYSQIKSLQEEDLQSLTGLLNGIFANHAIPDDWMNRHLAPVPKPEKNHTSIKGYRNVTMQNTVGKILEKIVAKRLASQLENDNLLPSTHGSYKTGKDTCGACI